MTFRYPYGQELILDLYNCDPNTFNRADIGDYFTKLCKAIYMEKCDVHFWDDVGVPKSKAQTHPDTKGTSAVCFIMTSSIVIHTLDIREEVFINIFSCKEFDTELARFITLDTFSGYLNDETVMKRGDDKWK